MKSDDERTGPALAVLIDGIHSLQAPWHSGDATQAHLSQTKSLLLVIDFLQTVAPDLMSNGGAGPLQSLLDGTIDDRTSALRNESELDRTRNEKMKRGPHLLGTAEMYLRAAAIACVERLVQADYKAPVARKFVAAAFTSSGRRVSASQIGRWADTWYWRQPVPEPENGARETFIHVADAKAAILEALESL